MVPYASLRQYPRMGHLQNFNNLILDYPHEALAFFAESEAIDLPPPPRQHQYRRPPQPPQ